MSTLTSTNLSTENIIEIYRHPHQLEIVIGRINNHHHYSLIISRKFCGTIKEIVEISTNSTNLEDVISQTKEQLLAVYHQAEQHLAQYEKVGFPRLKTQKGSRRLSLSDIKLIILELKKSQHIKMYA